MQFIYRPFETQLQSTGKEVNGEIKLLLPLGKLSGFLIKNLYDKYAIRITIANVNMSDIFKIKTADPKIWMKNLTNRISEICISYQCQLMSCVPLSIFVNTKQIELICKKNHLKIANVSFYA